MLLQFTDTLAPARALPASFGIRFPTAITSNGDIDGTAITGVASVCTPVMRY